MQRRSVPGSSSVVTIAILTFLLADACAAADIMGQATVIDGDTIEIHGQRIRLFGIDAPESRQTCEDDGREYRCGKDAAFALADHIGRQTVKCEDHGRDRYDRMIAICYSGSQDLSAWLVEQGWALAYRRYSVAYVGNERAAESAGRGMWQGEFVAPWDCRKGVR